MRHLIGILVFALTFTVSMFIEKSYPFNNTKITSTPTSIVSYKLDSSWVYMSHVQWEYPPKEILETYEDKFQYGTAEFLIFYPSGEFFKITSHVEKYNGRIDTIGPDTITRKGKWVKNDDDSMTTVSKVIYAPYGPKGICDKPLVEESWWINGNGLSMNPAIAGYQPVRLFDSVPKGFTSWDWLEEMVDRNSKIVQCAEE